jgi:hypothetical protein
MSTTPKITYACIEDGEIVTYGFAAGEHRPLTEEERRAAGPPPGFGQELKDAISGGTEKPEHEQVVVDGSTLLVRTGESLEDVQARMTDEAYEAERARADAGESVVS